ncbi:hypothetical protein BaRGS_00031096, partial [Batillaria attramentaria]
PGHSGCGNEAGLSRKLWFKTMAASNWLGTVTFPSGHVTNIPAEPESTPRRTVCCREHANRQCGTASRVDDLPASPPHRPKLLLATSAPESQGNSFHR